MTKETKVWENALPKAFASDVSRWVQSYHTSGNNLLAAVYYSVVFQIAPHRNTHQLKVVVGAMSDSETDRKIVNRLVSTLCKGVRVNQDGLPVIKKELTLDEEKCAAVFDAMNKGLSFRSSVIADICEVPKKEDKPTDWDKTTAKWAKKMRDEIKSPEEFAKVLEMLQKHLLKDTPEEPNVSKAAFTRGSSTEVAVAH